VKGLRFFSMGGVTSLCEHDDIETRADLTRPERYRLEKGNPPIEKNRALHAWPITAATPGRSPRLFN
jgi:hypothetical protein